MAREPRLAVADPRRLVREGLAAHVPRRPFRLVVLSSSPREALRSCREGAVDVLVLSLALGPTDVHASLDEHRVRKLRQGVVLLAEENDAVPSVPSGLGVPLVVANHAGGFDHLLQCCRRVGTGPHCHTGGAPARKLDVVPQPLTDRQLEILQLIAGGKTTRQISGTLGIRPKTVEAHTQRLLHRLDVQSRAHAVAVAVREGLLVEPLGA